MNKSKVLICFSAIISLVMSYVSTSDYFFYLPYPEDFDMRPTILGQLTHVISRLNGMSATNFIIMTIFLLNSVSLILYLLKKDIRVEIKKYFSFGCILMLIIGLILFVIDISCSSIYYENNYEHLPLNFRIFMLIPQILKFSITTFYLLGVQIYMIKKVKGVKLNKKSVILSIYIASVVFITIITFCSFSEVSDKVLGHLKLKIVRGMLGEYLYYVSEPNISYYIFYVLSLTVFFGAIFGISELFRRKRKKQQTLKA